MTVDDVISLLHKSYVIGRRAANSPSYPTTSKRNYERVRGTFAEISVKSVERACLRKFVYILQKQFWPPLSLGRICTIEKKNFIEKKFRYTLGEGGRKKKRAQKGKYLDKKKRK